MPAAATTTPHTAPKTTTPVAKTPTDVTTAGMAKAAAPGMANYAGVSVTTEASRGRVAYAERCMRNTSK